MTGRRSLETLPERTPVSSAPVILDVRNLRAGAKIGPISFRLRTGEILGLVGLEGSGVEDIFHGLFGVEQLTSGEVIYDGQRQEIRSPVDAVRLGWGFIPASRREQGLMMNWSIRRNTTLVILDRLSQQAGVD